MGRLLDRGGVLSRYYRLPFYFMVTLKRQAGLAPLCWGCWDARRVSRRRWRMGHMRHMGHMGQSPMGQRDGLVQRCVTTDNA